MFFTNIDVGIKSVAFLSSIAWIIKMERIHYERQQKLEAIATDMYKNSVLVSLRFSPILDIKFRNPESVVPENF